MIWGYHYFRKHPYIHPNGGWPWEFWTINSINMFTNFQNQNTPSGLCLLWKSLPLLNFQLDDPPWRYSNLILDWPRLQWIQISYTEGDELPSTFQGLDVAKIPPKTAEAFIFGWTQHKTTMNIHVHWQKDLDYLIIWFNALDWEHW